MAFTKEDKLTLKSLFTEQKTNMLSEMDKRFTHQMEEIDKRFLTQGKSIAQGFADLKAVMENTYVSREELQNEVDDLKKQVQALQKHIHTP